MREVALYVATVLIWGTTWIAVTFQTGKIAPEVSVFYRFAMAGLLFLGYAALRRVRLSFSTRDHGWMAVQGVLLSLAFLCIYMATTYVSSGFVAIVFSLVAALNMVGMRVFFGQELRASPMLGAVLGIAGVALIFGPASASTAQYRDPVVGLSLSSVGTLAAALASMVIVRNQAAGVPLVPLNAFGLLYGAGFAAICAALRSSPFHFDWSLRYLASLLYLSVVGSVLVFAAYFELIRRMGADRAGYVAVAAPVIALLISSVFEDLRLDSLVATGLVSCVIGNMLALRAGTQRPVVVSRNPLP